tara:strand:- start:197 stop:439 length:243 start_codon:yes stop_codon:yes gene_type:complete
LECNLATWPKRQNENNIFRARQLIHIYSSQLAVLQDRQPVYFLGQTKRRHKAMKQSSIEETPDLPLEKHPMRRGLKVKNL